MYTPNLYDNPAFDDENFRNQIKTQQFFSHLTTITGGQMWVSASPENLAIYHQLVQYQIQNGWTSESEQVCFDVIEAVADYQVEFGISPETKEVVDDFVDSVLNGDPDADGSNVILEAPPSCHSFHFTPTTSNWQESAVKNIRFMVVVLTPQGAFINHVVEYPNPILFGMPRNIQIGNTNVTPEVAATVSAHVLNQAMRETKAKYGNKLVSPLIVDLYFESRLKENYKQYIPGGRVNIHPTNYTVTPTEYRNLPLGTDTCM